MLDPALKRDDTSSCVWLMRTRLYSAQIFIYCMKTCNSAVQCTMMYIYLQMCMKRSAAQKHRFPALGCFLMAAFYLFASSVAVVLQTANTIIKALQPTEMRPAKTSCCFIIKLRKAFISERGIAHSCLDISLKYTFTNTCAAQV